MTKDEMSKYVRFREIAKDDIPTTDRKRNKIKSRWATFVDEFIESEFEAAEIDIPEGKKIDAERSALYTYLKMHGYTDMLKVVQRQNRLFIVNETINKPKKRTSNTKKAFKKKTKPRRKLTPEETMIGSSYVGIYPGSESPEVDHL